MVFALGLKVSPQDTTCLLRRPGLLLRSVVSMNIIMPLVAALLVASLNLHPAVKVALVALSVSPVPPLLPIKGSRAGGASSYAFSLLAIEAALAILSVPLSMLLFEKAFGWQARASPLAVALIVLMTVLVPLGGGVLVRSIALSFAQRVARPASAVAAVLLVVSVVPILFVAMPSVVLLAGNGNVAVITLFILAGLAVGDRLGGPAMVDRPVLALSTSSRHPAVALAVAGAGCTGERLVLAAVLLYLIVNAIVSLAYIVSRARRALSGRSPELRQEK
jgi:BASS family bile acid:Na+ symporter